MVVKRFIFLLVSAAIVAGTDSCRPREEIRKDSAEFSLVATSLISLSEDLKPILSEGSISNIAQLRTEYHRRYPQRPPLFTVVPMKLGVVRNSEYELPSRDYYWLRVWSTQDSPGTPLFWSYFHIPKDLVDYLTIDGTEHACSLYEFSYLTALLSNRVERVDLAAPDLFNSNRASSNVKGDFHQRTDQAE